MAKMIVDDITKSGNIKSKDVDKLYNEYVKEIYARQHTANKIKIILTVEINKSYIPRKIFEKGEKS